MTFEVKPETKLFYRSALAVIDCLTESDREAKDIFASTVQIWTLLKMAFENIFKLCGTLNRKKLINVKTSISTHEQHADQTNNKF